MKSLLPFIKLFKRQWFMMLIGLFLTCTTIIAGIGLLSLSGWFLSATAIAGLTAATALAFNFFTPLVVYVFYLSPAQQADMVND